MEEILTLEEVAKYLKVKPQTIYTWAQSGKIPAAKLGKEWRFRKSVIDKQAEYDLLKNNALCMVVHNETFLLDKKKIIPLIKFG